VFEEDKVEKSVSVCGKVLLHWVDLTISFTFRTRAAHASAPSTVETHARSFVPLVGETGYCPPLPARASHPFSLCPFL
jgi:hypothetical protein